MRLSLSDAVQSVRHKLTTRRIEESYGLDLHCKSDSELYATIGRYQKDEIKQAYVRDRWLQNYFLNLWEYATGQDVLESYPWNVSLPLADLCNARCTFCDSWLRGEGVMKLAELERFVEVLRVARLIGLQGHGEPLANPQIEAIVARLSKIVDRRTRAYIITNGALLEKKLDHLLKAKVLQVYNISLNAATSSTHHKVMGLGETALGSILSSIRRLVHVRETQNPAIEVTISLVLNRDNIAEASDFVRLGNELRVNRIYLRTLMPIAPPKDAASWSAAEWDTAVLMPQGLNYHLLPPYLHPDFASIVEQLRSCVAASIVPIDAQPETWSQAIFSPDVAEYLDRKKPASMGREEAMADRSIRLAYRSASKEVQGRGEFIEEVPDDGVNPYGRAPHFPCRFVYHNLNCNEVGYRLVPCCYMADVPGYKPVVFDGQEVFMNYWNSPAFVKLRQRLRDGPLFSPCKICPNQG